MPSSIIIISKARGGFLEYLYPSGDGHLLVIYTDRRKLEEMMKHISAGLGDTAALVGLRVEELTYDLPAEVYAEVLKEQFGPAWVRDHGAAWASKVAFIQDNDQAFERMLRSVREDGIPQMVIQVAGDPLPWGSI